MKKTILILLTLLNMSCQAQQKDTMKDYKKAINRSEAIQIAKNDANGFLGTWVDCSLKNRNWHISAHSKSANPPKYYVISAENGEILLRLDNTDNPNQKEKLDTYLKNLQENTMEGYEKAVDSIINQIIALKSKHPEQLRTIDRELKGELIDFNPYIHKEISKTKFWVKFHYEKGKNLISPLSSSDHTFITYNEYGISINIYFFKGDWTGDRGGHVIPFGELNIVTFIGNNKNKLYQDIEIIIISEREKLKIVNNEQQSTTEDYEKAIELAEKLMIEKKLILDEYNLVKLQHKALYGRDKGVAKTSVWEIIYRQKSGKEDDYLGIKGGEIFIEVDLKTQTAKITGWGE